jgi:hypothetical protein
MRSSRARRRSCRTNKRCSARTRCATSRVAVPATRLSPSRTRSATSTPSPEARRSATRPLTDTAGQQSRGSWFANRLVAKSARAVGAPIGRDVAWQRLPRVGMAPHEPASHPSTARLSSTLETPRSRAARLFQPGPHTDRPDEVATSRPQLDACRPRRAPRGASQPLPSSRELKGARNRSPVDRTDDTTNTTGDTDRPANTGPPIGSPMSANATLPAAGPITGPPGRSTHRRGTGPDSRHRTHHGEGARHSTAATMQPLDVMPFHRNAPKTLVHTRFVPDTATFRYTSSPSPGRHPATPVAT